MISFLSFCTPTLLNSPPSSSSSSSQNSYLIASPYRFTRFSVGLNFRAKMSSPELPPLPENRIILGCGGLGLDFLAAVAAYPKPDEKIRSTSLKVQGGGNAGNALTCTARLGLHPRIIAKVADDAQGKNILEELKADRVDTSFLVDRKLKSFGFVEPHLQTCPNGGNSAVDFLLWKRVSKEGNSTMTYVIVDNETKTRTCISTPGNPPMIPDDLLPSSLFSALDRARLVYLDGRLHETALIIAQEASRKKIPILIDAERKREGLDGLLALADYVVCSARFPQAWTEAPSVPSALVSMLMRLPNIKFVIVTLGEDGCMMLERSIIHELHPEETDVDVLLESLKQRKDGSIVIPTCLPSQPAKLRANGIGAVNGRLLLGTAEKIPPSELVDTTGAGDAFIGAVLYAICADMPPEKMLPFASQVAAAGCRALGARTGLPFRTDPRLASFLC